ncbi:MAG: Asp-tRNA(Asn)/Glu-tRNA(Gln) amidotransferase subunit GatC [bacterium]
MISKEEIKHVADLAKLEISNQEINKYSKELSAVVDYIGQLKEVDTQDTAITAQVTGLTNKTREDKVKNWNKAEVKQILKQAKSKPGQEITIPRVLK